MSVSTPEPIGKGLWLTVREIGYLTAAEAAGKAAREAAQEPDQAYAASAAQADALRNTSWRTRFLAVMTEVLRAYPENPLASADPLGLAMGILERAPAARSAAVPSEETLRNYEEAARRLFQRASTAEPTVTLATDEARELAVTLLDLFEAVRELA